MEKEERAFLKAAVKLENLVRINSNCRHDRGIKSCYACDSYKTCQANDYDSVLTEKKNAGEKLPVSIMLELNKKARGI